MRADRQPRGAVYATRHPTATLVCTSKLRRYSMTISIAFIFVVVKGLSALGIVDFSD